MYQCYVSYPLTKTFVLNSSALVTTSFIFYVNGTAIHSLQNILLLIFSIFCECIHNYVWIFLLTSSSVRVLSSLWVLVPLCSSSQVSLMYQCSPTSSVQLFFVLPGYCIHKSNHLTSLWGWIIDIPISTCSFVMSIMFAVH
jgi:hypothetical protein